MNLCYYFSKEMQHDLILGVHFLDFQGTVNIYLDYHIKIICVHMQLILLV